MKMNKPAGQRGGCRQHPKQLHYCVLDLAIEMQAAVAEAALGEDR